MNGFWGRHSRFIYLFLASSVLLLAFLGNRELWAQEHRWAEIVSNMFARHDFFQPFLNGTTYFDKPIFSYWLIAFFSFVAGDLTIWALRLPSVLAGLLAIFAIYRLGTRLKNKELGLLSGWMLLTTFYFIFWARTTSADMLNLAGSLFAVTWYFEQRYKASFFSYVIFFLILALTVLCKGLVGLIVPLIVILPDLIAGGKWRLHLKPAFFVAMIPSLVVYLFPFWAASHVSGYKEGLTGLDMVYRENILRYFQPFDHTAPIYIYLIYLPLYMLPWSVFLIPALLGLKNNWKKFKWESKWIVWAVSLLFIFFTLSGSRRSYYILPVVPFGILMVANWVLFTVKDLSQRLFLTRLLPMASFLLLLIIFCVVQPVFFARGGSFNFAADLKKQATQIKPWQQWDIVMLDAESNARFYLGLSPFVKNYVIPKKNRSVQTMETLLKQWPILKDKPTDKIFISRELYAPFIQYLLPHHHAVFSQQTIGEKWLKIKDPNALIAFVPNV